ncbi:ABC-2 transporter permease [Lentibacillus saliphilus]|uniref:ABC-2 transporter permease n=1 Tax=Lentibacillus saliphilus TaxID=2737028 RepID=UPI001C2F2EED|nr:ABC-2 transporter permease [Lentibacillus saliphilus]
MKGLLIKDFKLMKAQKHFYLLIVAIAVGMAVFTEVSSFIIGYMAFIGSLFTLSTISYDEFDNGNAFIFSLPINRKCYVKEKYGFGLIVGGSSWLLGTIIVLGAGLTRDHNLILDTLMTALMVLPAMLMILAFMLPFQLKFGGEKSRIGIMGALGLMFIIGVLIVKIAKSFSFDLVSMLNNLSTMSIGMLNMGAIVIAVVALLLSYKISVSIMNKKEF